MHTLGKIFLFTQYIASLLLLCSPAYATSIEALQYRDQGNASQAIKTLQQQLTQATASGRVAQQIQLQLQLSTLYLRQRDLPQAAAILATVQQQLPSLSDPRQRALLQASLALQQGTLAVRQQQLSPAQRHYQRAAQLAEQHQQIPLTAKAWLNLAQIAPQTAGFYAKAVAWTRRMPDSLDKSWHWLKLGRLAPSQTARLQHWQAALALGQDFDDARVQAFAYGFLGELYLQADRYREATQLTQQAVFFTQQAATQDSLYRWRWQQGRIAAAQQQLAAAIDLYQQAVEQLKTLKAGLRLGYDGESAEQATAVETLYFELADLLLQQASQARSTTDQQALLKTARDTIEQLKSIELQNYFQDDCITALQAKQTALTEVLPTHTAVLYPIILSTRTELLLTLPDHSLQQITLIGDAMDLNRQIERFIVHLNPIQGRRLYEWLIAPLQPLLQQQAIDTLVIVPHGKLRTLPFAALHNGEQYLIEQLALAITPSLALTDPHRLPRDNLSILLGGVSEAVQQFPPLPAVTTELNAIHALYGGAIPLKNQQFVVNNLSNALSLNAYHIVHFASHGQFHSDPEHSFVLTYDTKLNLDGLADLIQLGQFRDEPIELLTLSACQTARGNSYREYEQAALGLAGVAIKAGARSALASLWAVDDVATALLIPEFYRALQHPKFSKAQALQHAQHLLLKNPIYRHPKFWAGFILIGNWL